jgi:acyl-CoA thioester hydrolase
MTAAFSHPVRVYWEDTDAGGIVFYANYLKFLERARTEWLRAAGFGQQFLRDEFDTLFVVTEAHLRWHAPARVDDELWVTVALAAPPRSTVRLEQEVRRGDERLVSAEVTLACIGAGTFAAKRIPKPVRDALDAHIE